MVVENGGYCELEIYPYCLEALKGIAGELVGVNLTKCKRKPFLGGVGEVL